MKKFLIAAIAVGIVLVPSYVAARRSGEKADRKQETTNQSVRSSSDTTVQGNSVSNTSTSTTNVNIQSQSSSSVSSSDAISKAQAQMPGKTLKKVETENENGRTIYSVRFTDGSRVDIQADNGSTVRIETETKIESSSGGSHSED